MNNVADAVCLSLNICRLEGPAGIVSLAGFVNLTDAIRAFNLSTAVAPGEWPNPHEGVTTDEDPRHRGTGCPWGCDAVVCDDDLCLECMWARSGLWIAPYGFS